MTRALKLAKKADKRSKKALKRAKRGAAGARGPIGPAGPAGPAGPSRSAGTSFEDARTLASVSTTPLMSVPLTLTTRSRVVANSTVTVGQAGGNSIYRARCRISAQQGGQPPVDLGATSTASGNTTVNQPRSVIANTGLATLAAGAYAVQTTCSDDEAADAQALSGSLTAIATADAG